MVKYIVGFLVLAAFVFLGVTLFQTATNGSDKEETPLANTIPAKSLPEYAGTDAEVRVTVDGPIVGEETHRAIRITISRDERTLDIIQGYQGLVIKTQDYDNDQASFDVFLRAINGLGFTSSKKPKVADEYTVCPTGTRYTYELTNTESPETDVRLWSVSCGFEFGSFAGGPGPTIRSLFQKQIPDYAKLVEGVSVAPIR